MRLLSRKGSSFRLRSPSLNWLRLRRVFDLLDKNGDGVITVDEISKALILLGLHSDQSDSDLHSIITSFIKPGAVGLAFDDFQALHNSLNEDHVQPHPQPEQADHQLQFESDLTEAFNVFDQDGDGFISAKELQSVLSKLGLPEAHQDLHHMQLMISSFDHNHDGLVDFFEFKHMMFTSLLVLPSSS